ncbi:MAG: YtcA family lipoprotein [Candidatus Acidiferrum sp.]|jgi:hypothetical protein
MSAHGHRKFLPYTYGLISLALAGCARAPSFDILGSFFPAWLACVAVGIVLAVLTRMVLNRYIEIVLPVLVYPSLAIVYTLTLWLLLFR